MSILGGVTGLVPVPNGAGGGAAAPSAQDRTEAQTRPVAEKVGGGASGAQGTTTETTLAISQTNGTGETDLRQNAAKTEIVTARSERQAVAEARSEQAEAVFDARLEKTMENGMTDDRSLREAMMEAFEEKSRLAVEAAQLTMDRAETTELSILV